MKKNSFIVGCIVGAPGPFVAYLITCFSSLADTMHPLSLYVIAAVVNLLLIRYFYRQSLERNAQGVLSVTFIALLLLIFIGKVV